MRESDYNPASAQKISALAPTLHDLCSINEQTGNESSFVRSIPMLMQRDDQPRILRAAGESKWNGPSLN